MICVRCRWTPHALCSSYSVISPAETTMLSCWNSHSHQRDRNWRVCRLKLRNRQLVQSMSALERWRRRKKEQKKTAFFLGILSDLSELLNFVEIVFGCNFYQISTQTLLQNRAQVSWKIGYFQTDCCSKFVCNRILWHSCLENEKTFGLLVYEMHQLSSDLLLNNDFNCSWISQECQVIEEYHQGI